jgi:D-sedoheptulose 7-phosphate isomerase
LTPQGREHADALTEALRVTRAQWGRIESWGERLAERLLAGSRLLAAGNGGSAAQAQHLTGELVGRYREDRPPLSAIALHADASALTAITNDYGTEEPFARALRAHARPGDVLVALSTSGASPNVLSAVEAAAEMEVETWALTGPGPNPLAEACDEYLCVEAPTTATIQEVHLVAVHVLCAEVEARVLEASRAGERKPREAFR